MCVCAFGLNGGDTCSVLWTADECCAGCIIVCVYVCRSRMFSLSLTQHVVSCSSNTSCWRIAVTSYRPLRTPSQHYRITTTLSRYAHVHATACVCVCVCVCVCIHAQAVAHFMLVPLVASSSDTLYGAKCACANLVWCACACVCARALPCRLLYVHVCVCARLTLQALVSDRDRELSEATRRAAEERDAAQVERAKDRAIIEKLSEVRV